MKFKQKIGLQGFYKFVATKRDGSQRVLADWHENLILDAGLNRLGVGGVLERCQVGSGNTAPATGQTALTTLVASTTTVQSQVAGTDTPTNTYAFCRTTYRFGEGVAAGNLAEVGVGWSSGLFSRSLIRDTLGDPTTITILADESLDVSYEVRAYPVMTDQVVTLNISGADYEFTIRPGQFTGNQSNVGNWPEQLVSFLTNGFVTTSSFRLSMGLYGTDAALAAVTGIISGSGIGTGGAEEKSFRTSYVNNSYERACRMRYGLSAGNGNIGGLFLQSMLGNYQMLVDPPIPKTTSNILTLDFTLAWARRP